MRIVVDENIPYGAEVFGTLGETATAPGRSITRETLADADLLIVRSITKVDATLLADTPVRFVGTCTIGEDHIDKAWLAKQAIGFSSAPGCNANSVAEYVVAALLALAERHALDLERCTLGIVGVGNVGTKVAHKAQALGMTCVLNDPPLAAQTGDERYRPIAEVFDCDIVTLHVPLEDAGPHPTHHLVDHTFLERMKPGALLINTSRGPVVDSGCLERAVESGRLRGCVLDVWEDEPDVDPYLLELTDIATPHIAGYSFDGKVNGTMQVYEAACRHLGVPAEFDVTPLLPAPGVPVLTVYPDEPDALPRTVRAVYDILADDAAMRGRILSASPAERAERFDRLRRDYPVRREFFNTRLELAQHSPALKARLAEIGFTIAPVRPQYGQEN